MKASGYEFQIWSEAFRACSSPQDIRDVYSRLLEEAKHGDTTAIAIWCRYILGQPPKGGSSRVIDVGPAAIGSLDDCVDAANAILRGQLSGVIDRDTAQDLRQTVELAMRAQGAIETKGRPTDNLPVEVVVESYQRPAQIEQEDAAQ